MIGEALRLIRVYHDLKQKDAAAVLGISTSFLSEIEKGRKTPSLDLIKVYADRFGIPASSILFFAESVEGVAHGRARTFVAGKMIGLMQFLEARTDKVDVD